MGAYYCAKVGAFLAAETRAIVGELASGEHADRFFAHMNTQTGAWEYEVALLKRALSAVLSELPAADGWSVLLEYPIPRRGKRIDAVILARDVIVVLEFKTGEQCYTRASMRQAEDYALELSDFHAESRARTITPILVATGMTDERSAACWIAGEGVAERLACGEGALARGLADAFLKHSNPRADAIDAARWNRSEYRPVPTIIEAAELLFAGHNVTEIAHSHSEAKNLTETTNALLRAVEEAESRKQKVICFVTGVPGAGKTLAGLKFVHHDMLRERGRPSATFLSGNGPLVRVISEALVRDHASRNRVSRAVAAHRIAKIESVHSFIKTHFEDPERRPSYNRVVVFDEAQRAWSREQQFKKFKRDVSEPSVMLGIMDRHDWAVIVALVGGGQEIFSGEAGLAEWGRSLTSEYGHWKVVASPEAVHGGSSVAGSTLFDSCLPSNVELTLLDVMHLPVSTPVLKAKNAEAVNNWVNAVVAGEPDRARVAAAGVSGFPVRLTRSLSTVRRELRAVRGLKRTGLVASSGALRLRAFGIELSTGFTNGFPWQEWFLAGPDDVRSSYQLEVAASEFQCQGLELDVVGLCWGNDMTWDRANDRWCLRQFKGAKWQRVGKPEKRDYLVNAYRVLLTRAREALVIWVPRAVEDDGTMTVTEFDATADYLLRCGAESID